MNSAIRTVGVLFVLLVGLCASVPLASAAPNSKASIRQEAGHQLRRAWTQGKTNLRAARVQFASASRHARDAAGQLALIAPVTVALGTVTLAAAAANKLKLSRGIDTVQLSVATAAAGIVLTRHAADNIIGAAVSGYRGVGALFSGRTESRDGEQGRATGPKMK